MLRNARDDFLCSRRSFSCQELDIRLRAYPRRAHARAEGRGSTLSSTFQGLPRHGEVAETADIRVLQLLEDIGVVASCAPCERQCQCVCKRGDTTAPHRTGTTPCNER